MVKVRGAYWRSCFSRYVLANHWSMSLKDLTWVLCIFGRCGNLSSLFSNSIRIFKVNNGEFVWSESPILIRTRSIGWKIDTGVNQSICK